jgi:orotidine-5'-phosphate decarboxylase
MGGTFFTKLAERWAEGKFLCVGLDPDIQKMPKSLTTEHGSIEDAIVAFNKGIIDATADVACAMKPNSAFYEAYGEEGLRALKKTAAYLAENYPELPTILDAKRADIGNTNEKYAEAVFDELGFGGVTIHPYLGRTAIQPFLDRKDRGIFILVKTSNEGSAEFQDLLVGNETLYERISRAVSDSWNQNWNCGVVVGATYPEELSKVRTIVGDMPILVPGIGAQGGDAKTAFNAAKNKNGTGVLIAVSRSIIYASDGPDFAEAARREAEKISNSLSSNKKA